MPTPDPTYETVETMLCAGADIARLVLAGASNAERSALQMLLAAANGDPNARELRHTRDVLEMVRNGNHSAAWSMYVAYAQAEIELEEAGARRADMLDLYLAGVILTADRWRIEHCLPLSL